jgi:hypothetical protein
VDGIDYLQKVEKGRSVRAVGSPKRADTAKARKEQEGGAAVPAAASIPEIAADWLGVAVSTKPAKAENYGAPGTPEGEPPANSTAAAKAEQDAAASPAVRQPAALSAVATKAQQPAEAAGTTRPESRTGRRRNGIETTAGPTNAEQQGRAAGTANPTGAAGHPPRAPEAEQKAGRCRRCRRCRRWRRRGCRGRPSRPCRRCRIIRRTRRHRPSRRGWCYCRHYRRYPTGSRPAAQQCRHR